MRQGPGGRRPRGRPNRKQHSGPQRPNSFDSNGPEGRIRGNAHQVYERYIGLARDAVSSGDRVSAETFYQHAEHYFRIVNGSTDPDPNGRRVADQNRANGQGERNGADGPVKTERDASTDDGAPAQNDARPEPEQRKGGEDAANSEANDEQSERARAKAENGDGRAAPASPRRRGRPRSARPADQDADGAPAQADEPKPARRKSSEPVGDNEATGT